MLFRMEEIHAKLTTGAEVCDRSLVESRDRKKGIYRTAEFADDFYTLFEINMSQNVIGVHPKTF